jgi:uncharacterized phage protein (TIGR02220 family)
MEKIREQTRLRVAAYREKQKEQLVTLPVTLRNATDIEEDKEKEEEKEIYKSIVSYLNEKAGTGYKPTTAKTKSAINARLAEGFTVDDFKTVIDKKCAEWLGTDMEKYLRPETLFGTKFEGYLNAKTGRTGIDGQIAGDSGAVRRYGNYV